MLQAKTNSISSCRVFRDAMMSWHTMHVTEPTELAVKWVNFGLICRTQSVSRICVRVFCVVLNLILLVFNI